MAYKDEDNYSGDYIRPVEEYRSECSDEHGQTYSNYNSEQRNYDSFENVEGSFTAELFPGEQLLWCGVSERNATLSERGTSAAMLVFPVIWTSFSVFWTLLVLASGAGFMGLFGVPFILIGIGLFLSMGGKKNFAYAITSTRVIIKTKKGTSFYNLNEINNIQVTCSSRNIGSVTFFTNMMTQFRTSTNRTTNQLPKGIFGIHDPNGAARILSNAIYSMNTAGRQ